MGALTASPNGFEEQLRNPLQSECPGLEGTIGPNILKKCIWHIDYDNQRVIATDHLNKIPGIETAARIPVKTNNLGKPLMAFIINGRAGRFTFDTGRRGRIGSRPQGQTFPG